MKSLLIIATILGASLIAQARSGAEPQMKSIYCADISINLALGTLFAPTMGLENIPMYYTVKTNNYGDQVLVGQAEGVNLESTPDTKAGWSGRPNTVLRVGDKKLRTECNIN